MHNFAIAHNFTYKRLVFNDSWVNNGRRYNDGLSPSEKDCIFCLYCLPEFNSGHIFVVTVSVKIIPILDCHNRIPWLFYHIVTEGASISEITLVKCACTILWLIFEMEPQNDNIFSGGESSVANLVFAIVV